MLDAVAMVRVVVAAAPDGVTVVGEKLQVAPVGRPVHTNDTADENPFCGVMVAVAVPLDPAFTVREAGDAVTPKSTGGRL